MVDRDDISMTLRDYFAAKAMQILIPNGQSIDATRYAESAYAMADAMLKARGLPLYTTPQPAREWIGLTKEEFDLLVPYCFNEFDLNDYKEFARVIEAKLKEKNI